MIIAAFIHLFLSLLLQHSKSVERTFSIAGSISWILLSVDIRQSPGHFQTKTEKNSLLIVLFYFMMHHVRPCEGILTYTALYKLSISSSSLSVIVIMGWTIYLISLIYLFFFFNTDMYFLLYFIIKRFVHHLREMKIYRFNKLIVTKRNNPLQTITSNNLWNSTIINHQLRLNSSSPCSCQLSFKLVKTYVDLYVPSFKALLSRVAVITYMYNIARPYQSNVFRISAPFLSPIRTCIIYFMS